MAGLNPTADFAIAMQTLKTALQGFALVPDSVMSAQNQELAESLQKGLKAPAIFATFSHLDAINKYTIASTGWSGSRKAFWTSLGALNVWVYNIQDADVLNFALAFYLPAIEMAVPATMGFALSKSDAFNPVDLDQTCILGGSGGVHFTTPPSGNNYMFLSDTIPVSGYQYIHLMGGFGAASQDALATMGPGAGFGVRLIK